MKPTEKAGTIKVLIVAALIVSATLAVYGQVRNFDFLNFDDTLYVVQNSHVHDGLTAESARWALTTTELESWQPLVWLSFMLDYELHGLKGGGFHVTNLILHLLSTILLFGLVYRMTGALWRSAFVAAFFAVHPVHVESVAWVAERKDALSGFFFMLTLWLYSRYAAKPDLKKYALVLPAFVLGLMSKPMLVTIPVILILLDYWPLGRIGNKAAAASASSASGRFLSVLTWQMKEKGPLFALSLLCGIVVVTAQGAQNVVTGNAIHPFGARLTNAFVSFGAYLLNILTPYHLGAFYPFNEQIPLPNVMASVLLFVVLCAAALWVVRRYPFVFVGWFWFVIILLPVIGLIPLAKHAMADRYTYLSSIGISFILAWGLPELFKTDALKKKILLPAGILYLAVLGYLGWVQCGYWADNFSLFGHTLEVTKNNDLMHYSIGKSYLVKGDIPNARRHLHEAMRINPHDEKTYINLGLAYYYEGDKDRAMDYFTAGLKLNPQNDGLHANLAVVLKETGRIPQAIEHYRKAIALNPQSSAPRYNYATLLAEQGRLEEAEKELRAAVLLRPDDGALRDALAMVFLRQGRMPEVIEQLRELVRIDPGNPAVLYHLGLYLAQASRYDEAAGYLGRAAVLAPDNPDVHYNLGLILSMKGNPGGAEEHLRAALNLAPDHHAARRALEDLLSKKREK